MSDLEGFAGRFVWTADDLIVSQPEDTDELTPEEEHDVERRLEAAHFDVGEDDYGDWFSGADR